MVRLICLILGIVYVRRKGRIRKLQLPLGSGVSSQTLELWRSAEVKSIDCLLWASWGTFAVGVALIPITQAVGRGQLDLLFNTQIGLLLVFLAGLAVAAFWGERAKKYKKLIIEESKAGSCDLELSF